MHRRRFNVYDNFGKTSLNEVKKKLEKLQLELSKPSFQQAVGLALMSTLSEFMNSKTRVLITFDDGSEVFLPNLFFYSLF